MRYLLDELGRTDIALLHVDSKFAGDLGSLGKFSFKKVTRLFVYAWQMLCHVLRGGIDMVVLTPTFHFKPFLKDAVLVWWSTLILRRRTAAWFHMDYRALGYDQRSRLSRWFIRTTLRRCCRFVVVGEGLLAYLPDWMPPERRDAVANGIPAPLPSRTRPDDGRLRVLYLSNLEPDKGWEVLLETARNLCRELPNVEFVFHGRPAFGLTEDEVRLKIASDDGGGRIRYPGPVHGDAKWQALADADVFAFPSFHEALPLAILEAVAAGLPIAATEVGAVPDAVTHNEGGLLVPPRDAPALQAALHRILSDASLRSRMSAWNRQKYENHYTVAAYGRRWETWVKEHAVRR
jgi:glycosyltransferase involved in cell wall biosynthesis